MSGAKRRCGFSIAMFAVALLPGFGIAQTQQTGIQESTSATQSPTDATANTPVANPSRASSGASGWSAGHGSFGTNGKMPGATSGAVGATGGAAAGDTGQSSWVAGRGSFGSTAQSGGIWRENSENAEDASTGSANKPANRAYVPACSPTFKGAAPAFGNKSAGAQPAHAMVSHPSISPHVGVGTHLGASNVSRSSASGRGRTRPATSGPHSRTSAQRRSTTGKGSGKKPYGVGSTTQIPSGFTPPSATPDADTPDAGTAPEAPPQ